MKRYDSHSYRVRKSPVKIIILGLILIALIFLAAYIFEKVSDGEIQPAERHVEEQVSITDINGEKHNVSKSIESVLLIGLDKHEDEKSKESYVNNMQSDFISVVVFDNAKRSYTILIIDRDTMCPVTRLGVTGQAADTNIEQIALAHTYGSGKTDSCRNTMKSVKKLLFGAPIDHYCSFTLDVVGIVNDALGGVTIEIPEDMTSVNSAFTQGAVITLTGDEAEQFVRARRALGEDNNKMRISRHEIYLEALKEAVDDKGGAEVITDDVLLEINEYIVSDLSVDKMQSYIEKFTEYTFKGFIVPSGEFNMGDTYNEFFADENELSDIVISLFCK